MIDTVIILKNICSMLQTQDKYISDVNSAVEPKENVRIIDSEIYYRFKEFTLNQSINCEHCIANFPKGYGYYSC